MTSTDQPTTAAEDLVEIVSRTFWKDKHWSYGRSEVPRRVVASTALDGVPDGWAKIRGQWVKLESVECKNPQHDTHEENRFCCNNNGFVYKVAANSSASEVSRDAS